MSLEKLFGLIKCCDFENFPIALKAYLDDPAHTIDDQYIDCSTLLMQASMSGSNEIVKHVLEYNPKLDIEDITGKTAVEFAVQYQKLEALKCLFEKLKEAALDEIQEELNKALLCSVIYSVNHNDASKIIIAWLLEMGAQIDCQNRDNQTPLMLALIIGSTIISKFLLDNKASVSNSNQDKKTLLMYAIRNAVYSREIISSLAIPGVINAQDKQGRTALMIASELGLADIVRLLLDKGADANITDNSGHTALLYALSNNSDNTNLMCGLSNAKMNTAEILVPYTTSEGAPKENKALIFTAANTEKLEPKKRDQPEDTEMALPLSIKPPVIQPPRKKLKN